MTPPARSTTAPHTPRPGAVSDRALQVRRAGGYTRPWPLEEAELLRAVADQHVLRLLVVVEHHLVGLVIGEMLSKYLPECGGRHSPPM